MKKIRFGVFETNSSSSHSLSFNGECMIPEEDRKSVFPLEYDLESSCDVIKILLIECEFGRDFDIYTDPWNKLKYLVMMVVELECRKFTTLDEIYETEGFKLIQDNVPHKIVVVDDTFGPVTYTFKNGEQRTYLEHAGYIDHQSCTDNYSKLKDFFHHWGIDVSKFLYNSDINLIIDSDG